MSDLETAFHQHPASQRFFRDACPLAPDHVNAERVFLVPLSWHKDLVKYLSGTGKHPGSCWAGYHLLLQRRAEGLVYDKDGPNFGIVPYDLLPACARHFGAPPRDLIVRFWARLPGGEVRFSLTAAAVRLAAPPPSDRDGVQFIEVRCFPRLRLAQVIPQGWALADAADGWRDAEVQDAVLRYLQPWRLSPNREAG
jgi:hypothetical protein